MTKRVLVNESQKTLLYVREMVRLQWRALAGVFLMVTVYTTSWVSQQMDNMRFIFCKIYNA